MEPTTEQVIEYCCPDGTIDAVVLEDPVGLPGNVACFPEPIPGGPVVEPQFVQCDVEAIPPVDLAPVPLDPWAGAALAVALVVVAWRSL